MKNFEEKVSPEYKTKVLRAVQTDLTYNKHRAGSPLGRLVLGGFGTAFLATLIYFQFLNPVKQSSSLDVALNENLVMELAQLSPEEVEIVGDLDFMDALDKLSPEELEEIML